MITELIDYLKRDIGEAKVVGSEWCSISIQQAETIIAALEAASLSDQSAGDGWKMVPVEPTEAMIEAAAKVDYAEWRETSMQFRSDPSPLPTWDGCDSELKQHFRERMKRILIAAAPASPIPVDRRDVLEEADVERVAKAMAVADNDYHYEKTGQLMGAWKIRARAALGAMQHE